MCQHQAEDDQHGADHVIWPSSSSITSLKSAPVMAAGNGRGQQVPGEASFLRLAAG